MNLNRSLTILSLVVLLSIVTQAQDKRPCRQDADGRQFGQECAKPFGKLFIASSLAYWGSVGADIASSRGPHKYEGNPLLRGSDGRISLPRAFAVNGGIYALSVLLEHRKPRLASVLRFVGAGFHTAAAVHNYRVGG